MVAWKTGPHVFPGGPQGLPLLHVSNNELLADICFRLMATKYQAQLPGGQGGAVGKGAHLLHLDGLWARLWEKAFQSGWLGRLVATTRDVLNIDGKHPLTPFIRSVGVRRVWREVDARNCSSVGLWLLNKCKLEKMDTIFFLY